MTLHPSRLNLSDPGQLEHMAVLDVRVHLLALISLPILFMGALALSRLLTSPNRLAIGALVVYGFALAAVMSAAAFDGLVAPALMHELIASTSSPASEVWRILFRFNFQLNQAFALIFVLASSAAIVLWSIWMIRSRALSVSVGVYGCVLGPVTAIAVLSGKLTLTAHGFGLVILGESLWFIIVGVLLLRLKESKTILDQR